MIQFINDAFAKIFPKLFYLKVFKMLNNNWLLLTCNYSIVFVGFTYQLYNLDYKLNKDM